MDMPSSETELTSSASEEDLASYYPSLNPTCLLVLSAWLTLPLI